MRLAPDNAIAYGNLVGFYISLNRLDEAKSAYQDAMQGNLRELPVLHANMYWLAFLKTIARRWTARPLGPREAGRPQIFSTRFKRIRRCFTAGWRRRASSRDGPWISTSGTTRRNLRRCGRCAAALHEAGIGNARHSASGGGGGVALGCNPRMTADSCGARH